MSEKKDIICFSHLVWEDQLFQRPQQIMLRLARQGHRVFYIAQRSMKAHLLSFAGKTAPRQGNPEPNLHYWNLPGFIGPENASSEKDSKIAKLHATVQKIEQQFSIKDPVLWFYYPEYYPLVRLLKRSKLVYDCMDPFENFQKAGPSLEHNEKALAKRTDHLFFGGESLHKAKRHMNRKRSRCYPSGIDVEHFGKVLLDETQIPDDIKQLEKPVFGYFGAIDERLNFDLLKNLAEQIETGSVVLIGPLVGIKQLPAKHSRLKHLGAKPYKELPNYLKAFDVCLIPFVNNPLTDKMSPTKTPEYLAGGKPVVSTPVPDIVEQYGDLISIAETPEEFSQACIKTANEKPDQNKLVESVRKLSWDEIAKQMSLELDDETPPAPIAGLLRKKTKPEKEDSKNG